MSKSPTVGDKRVFEEGSLPPKKRQRLSQNVRDIVSMELAPSNQIKQAGDDLDSMRDIEEKSGNELQLTGSLFDKINAKETEVLGWREAVGDFGKIAALYELWKQWIPAKENLRLFVKNIIKYRDGKDAMELKEYVRNGFENKVNEMMEKVQSKLNDEVMKFAKKYRELSGQDKKSLVMLAGLNGIQNENERVKCLETLSDINPDALSGKGLEQLNERDLESLGVEKQNASKICQWIATLLKQVSEYENSFPQNWRL